MRRIILFLCALIVMTLTNCTVKREVITYDSYDYQEYYMSTPTYTRYITYDSPYYFEWYRGFRIGYNWHYRPYWSSYVYTPWYWCDYAHFYRHHYMHYPHEAWHYHTPYKPYINYQAHVRRNNTPGSMSYRATTPPRASQQNGRSSTAAKPQRNYSRPAQGSYQRQGTTQDRPNAYRPNSSVPQNRPQQRPSSTGTYTPRQSSQPRSSGSGYRPSNGGSPNRGLSISRGGTGARR